MKQTLSIPVQQQQVAIKKRIKSWLKEDNQLFTAIMEGERMSNLKVIQIAHLIVAICFLSFSPSAGNLAIAICLIWFLISVACFLWKNSKV